MPRYDLVCLIACYLGICINFLVFLLLFHHMIRQKKMNKPLYWCFIVQCVVDFASCWIESFDYHWFGSYPLRKFSNEQVNNFFILSSWSTISTALVWQFAFFQKFRLAATLCLAVSLLSFLVLFKNECSSFCSLYNLDDAPAENSSVASVTLAVVADTGILIAPLLVNTLMTVGCMIAVLLLPSKKYSGSILQVYRKVTACLVFRVVGTLINVFLISSLVINQVYFYVIILTGEEIFPATVMEALYVVTDWMKPAHLWLYCLNPLSTVWLMHKLILKSVPVIQVYPVSRSTFGFTSTRTATAT